MKLQFEITYSGLADVKVTKKAFARAVNAAFIKAIRWWHRKVLPKHFQVGAERRYRYGRRTEKHRVRKVRAKGHGRPLVFSGDMEREVRSRITLKAAKTKPKVRGRMLGPDYLRPAGRPALTKNSIMGAAGSRQPDMGAEITHTTNFEQANMGRMIKAHVLRQLNRLPRRHRRRKKVG